MENRLVWMRKGDAGDYESFDSMFDAGSNISGVFEVMRVKKLPAVRKYGAYGVEVGDSFLGPYDYVSLFWGDDDAQPTKKLAAADIKEFRAGISDGLMLPARLRRSGKVKPAAKRRGNPVPTGVRNVRGVGR